MICISLAVLLRGYIKKLMFEASTLSTTYSERWENKLVVRLLLLSRLRAGAGSRLAAFFSL